MSIHIKTNFLFYTFTLFMCLNSFFLRNTDAQTDNAPTPPLPEFTYTYESIDVPGVDFLELTASSDFEDYAGNTRSADGEKIVGFTLIDGVFTTYDFPGAQNTYFYAFGNNGLAAGHYEDSDGLHHGIILENGELRQYDFPGAVETEIYGYSDSRGVLTGHFIDADGVRRGFSGDIIIEVPDATATYADFVNASGAVTGSYIDVDGLYHPYVRTSNGTFVFHTYLEPSNLEYFFVHGITDTRIIVARAKAVGDRPRSYVGTSQHGLSELEFPGSVSTEGYNINQDGSAVGYYDAADGRRHGFIARPTAETAAKFEDVAYLPAPEFNYVYESIDVPGVDFLELAASSDFEDYAGNTRSADGEKNVGFTLIDGVFKTHDFPGSQGTYFYALGNNGTAAGHYEDSDGLYHGVILENGELRQYDFPGAVETEIYGFSDSTGALTGNFIGADGVRRGFSGDEIVEAPEAVATYADFVNAAGSIIGSFVDADGLYHAFARTPTGRFIILDYLDPSNLEYFFLHGINDAEGSGVFVIARAKAAGDRPRSYVGSYLYGLHELEFPGSVSTEGYNINQDGSVVGHYDSPDGRRHGFIAKLTSQVEAKSYSNAYTATLSKGLNMISVPLAPIRPTTAKSLVALTGATTIITLDAASQQFVAWTPGAPDDGFPVEGGKGYIVNVPETRNFAFVGAPWMNQTEAVAAAPLARSNQVWAFVVSGNLEGIMPSNGYSVEVRNLRTNSVTTSEVRDTYFAAATVDLNYRSVVKVGDTLEVIVTDTDGNIVSEKFNFIVDADHLENAVMLVSLDSVGTPKRSQLLQNYPNPFNPETWIPYQLSEDASVSVSIYDTTGQLVRTLSLGFQSAGFYNGRDRAAYWDGRNALGERVASGIYFYQLITPSFKQTRRLVILK